MGINKKIWIIESFIMLVVLFSVIGKNHSFSLNQENTEVFNEFVQYQEESGSYVISAAALGETIDTENGVAMLGNPALSIAPGAYEIQVNYKSQTDENDAWGACDQVAGWLQIRSYTNLRDVKYNTIELVDGHTMQQDRMWITSLKSLQDVDIKVFFAGKGTLQIDSIVIRELMIFRVTKVLCCILLLAGINFILVYFFGKHQYQGKNITAGLLVIIFISSLPVFTDFIMGGHDLPFHLSRILSLGRTLESGKLWAPLEYDMVNGYGYPNPLFYGQLFLYIPAFLYVLAVPIHTAYQIYVLCVNAATCLIAYYCCKKICKNPKIALFGAGIYTLSAYRLIDVYVRAAVGEFTAMVFLPLVLLGFWLVYTKEEQEIGFYDYLPIVLGLTGLFHSHLLTTEIVAIVIFITCVLLVKKTLQWKRLLTLLKTVIITILINLAYLLPFLDAMKMDVLVNTSGEGVIQGSGAYLLQLFGIFMTPSGKDSLQISGDMPICLGFAFLLGLLAFAWCMSKRQEWNIEEKIEVKTGCILAVLAILTILFSLEVFPWDSIHLFSKTIAKYACMIQFPWRYLSVATVLCTMISVLTVKIIVQFGRKETALGLGKAMTIFTLINMGLLYMQYADVSTTTQMYAAQSSEDSITNIYGGEYLLVGTETSELIRRPVITEDENVLVSDFESEHGISTFTYQNKSLEVKEIEIPVLNYPHYQALHIENGEKLEIATGANNRLCVKLPPQSEGKVVVSYAIPKLWYLASAISIAMCGMLIAKSVVNWKRSRRRDNGEIC